MSFFKLLWQLLCRPLSLLGLGRRRRYGPVSPVIGVDDAWVRPGEILVDVRFEGEIAKELAKYGGRPYKPTGQPGQTPDHKDWRRRTGAPWYGDINARLDEVGLRFHLWVGFSTSRAIQIVKERRLPGVHFNTVYFGEGYYQGGPKGLPTRVDAPKSFPTLPGGAAADVAVLDNGMPVNWDTVHPTLAGAVTFVGNPLLTQDPVDENGDDVLDEQAGHGLFICGVIGRQRPELTIELRRVLHATGETDDALASAALGECTAKVVNMSFGGFTFDDVVSPLMANAVNLAVGRDQVLVAAAGNNGGAATGSEFHNRAFWPAALPTVVAVGACDSTHPTLDHPLWTDSNRAEIYAPGVHLRSTYLQGWLKPGTPDKYEGWAEWSGTSFAAPVVAAEIAYAVKTKTTTAATNRDVATTWVNGQEVMLAWPGKNATSGKPTRFKASPKLSDW